MKIDTSFYEMIFNTIPHAVLVFDVESLEIVKVNRAALGKTEIEEDSLIGLPLGFFSSGREGFTSDILKQKMELTIAKGPQHFVWEADKDGEFHQFDLSLNIAEYQDKELLIMIAVDTTTKKN